MGTNEEGLKRLPKGKKSSFKKRSEAVGKKQRGEEEGTGSTSLLHRSFPHSTKAVLSQLILNAISPQ
ncbi:hypothetical protein [Hoylesella nanceiensis]|uniref:hypothetical protein n=1 Tax=Hoylesella nanceiensis TaxID=425941 RepID=UPI001CAF6703|nr:hypothetical protein [Hoylesella nanceiensis]MBF1429344.1 hypothetical protein [Hoylesella nanceiensis]